VYKDITVSREETPEATATPTVTKETKHLPEADTKDQTNLEATKDKTLEAAANPEADTNPNNLLTTEAQTTQTATTSRVATGNKPRQRLLSNRPATGDKRLVLLRRFTTSFVLLIMIFFVS